MFYALSWSVMFILLALWSLAAWAFHSIAAWIPPEFALALTATLSAAGPAVAAILDQAPALAGVLSVAVWAVWGVGSALIVILGLVCSRLITVLRRRASVFAASSTSPVAAD